MLASEVLQDLTTTLNDPNYVTWGEGELLQKISDAMTAIVVVRPDAYSVVEAIQLSAGTKQSVPAGALRLLDVLRNMGADGQTPGRAITPVHGDDMDIIDPSWHKRTAKSEVRHFVYDERTPDTFFVTPPAVAGIYVEAQLSKEPPAVTAPGDTLPLKDIYKAPIVEYTLYLAYNKETDSMESRQEAMRHLGQFNTLLGIKSKTDLTFSPNNAGSELK